MKELFFVVRFSDGDVRYLFFEYQSQVDNWCIKYKPNVNYEVLSFDSEKDYYSWLENGEDF